MENTFNMDLYVHTSLEVGRDLYLFVIVYIWKIGISNKQNKQKMSSFMAK